MDAMSNYQTLYQFVRSIADNQNGLHHPDVVIEAHSILGTVGINEDLDIGEDDDMGFDKTP